MKRIYIYFFPILFVILASGCKKKDPAIESQAQSSNAQILQFSVSYENKSARAGERVSIDENLDVLWSETEKMLVAVEGGEEGAKLSAIAKLVSGEGTTNGVFEVELPTSSTYYSLYPYFNYTPPAKPGMSPKPFSPSASYENGMLSAFRGVLSEKRSSNIISTTNDALAGVGVSKDGLHFKMKHLTGVLRLRITSDLEDLVTEIKLYDNNGKSIAGIYAVNPNDSDPVISFEGVAKDTISMILSDGVEIGPDGYSVFEFAIPGGLDIFKNGFTAKVIPLLHDTVVISSSCATIQKGVIIQADRYVELKEQPKPDPVLEKVYDGCGFEYDVIKIGEQKWLKQNMRCNVYDTLVAASYGTNMIKFAPGGSPSPYGPYYYPYGTGKDSYGYLYNFASALGYKDKAAAQAVTSEQSNRQGICPDGFRVPTVSDWQTLMDFIDSEQGDAVSAFCLKDDEVGHWKTDGWAMDLYGFKARPAGKVYFTNWPSANTPPEKSLQDIKTVAAFITATPYSAKNTRTTIAKLWNTDKVVQFDDTESKMNAFSVRCIKAE
ncbi:MAG: fibrobacter succinogenes major paralogous domain-containing protein [Paludibacteraceae bacterium]|nr:fibrobacter succinogenes major paralogous domain-containing protein [Paludibacteraceae bacterium]